MKKILNLVCFIGLFVGQFSCSNSENKDKSEKGLSDQAKISNRSQVVQQNKSKNFYIINVAAVKTESEAKAKARLLKNDNNAANYLWIPDYASLSGAKFYAVYIGPFSTQHDCEVAIEEYRKKHPEAYGLLVSQDNKRVQINGIGKVTVTDNQPSNNANLNVETFTKLPKELEGRFGFGAGCGYSKTKGGQYIFFSDVNGNALMKINNKFVLLRTNAKDIYVGDNLEVSVEITKTKPLGVESSEEEGYIIIKALNGNSIKINIYGGCGA